MSCAVVRCSAELPTPTWACSCLVAQQQQRERRWRRTVREAAAVPLLAAMRFAAAAAAQPAASCCAPSAAHTRVAPPGARALASSHKDEGSRGGECEEKKEAGSDGWMGTVSSARPSSSSSVVS